MFVVKRDGRREPVAWDKISRRIEALCAGLPAVDAAVVSQKVCAGVYSGVHTRELDALAADTAVALASLHPDYGHLAARLTCSDLHKRTPAAFTAAIAALAPRLKPALVAFVERHAEALDAAIDHGRDSRFDYFGLKTLERSYLYRVDGAVVERPQCLLLRVACALHLDDIAQALIVYDAMSRGLYTHATPTLFNAGSRLQTLSSCFLTVVPDDLHGIFQKIHDCAMISKASGGIGLSLSNVRANGAWIKSTMAKSSGIVPLCRLLDATAHWIDQGGRRKGSIAVYLEPWHADVEAFLDLRRNQGAESERARDLFLALWVPDLFMRRVGANAAWSLFSPDEAPGLTGCHGDVFDSLYALYESQGRARRVVRARDLWKRLIQAQIENGQPYLMFKDQINRASTQRHLGTVQCSNLCSEITIYSDLGETAVCNLASLSLPRFVRTEAGESSFDEQALADAAALAVRSLNRVIDANDHPTDEGRRSDARHRPIGVGVQGLANVFLALRMPYDSAAARALNVAIFSTLYYAALRESCALAQRDGPHASHRLSPAWHGVLHPDAYEATGLEPAGLRDDVRRHGVRNCLLVALMPTATTSQLLGNVESFEPLTSLIYVRRTLAGEFVVVCAELVDDLARLGLWSPELKDKIVANGGSVQGLPEVPADLQLLYRTAFEIPQRHLVEMAADRAPYVDQSSSQNVFLEAPTLAKLTSYHFLAWEKKLKTSSYYVRTKPASAPVAVTLAPPETCTACSL